MFIVISLAAKVATTSSSRRPSRIVTSVVGPNSSPWSVATISDGRSVGDRSNVPARDRALRPGGDDRVVERDAAADQPLREQLLADRRLGRSIWDRHGHAPLLGRRRLVGEHIGLVPPHEVLDDAVLDGAGVLLDPGHHPRREDRVEPEDDEDAEERDRAQRST